MGKNVDKESEVTPEQTIVIPAHIDLESMNVREALPSGTFAQGDVLILNPNLKDKDGVVKSFNFDRIKIHIKDWPTDPDQEILAVVYVNFVVAQKGTQI
jgi:hypothetical protein